MEKGRQRGNGGPKWARSSSSVSSHLPQSTCSKPALAFPFKNAHHHYPTTLIKKKRKRKKINQEGRGGWGGGALTRNKRAKYGERQAKRKRWAEMGSLFFLGLIPPAPINMFQTSTCISIVRSPPPLPNNAHKKK